MRTYRSGSRVPTERDSIAKAVNKAMSKKHLKRKQSSELSSTSKRRRLSGRLQGSTSSMAGATDEEDDEDEAEQEEEKDEMRMRKSKRLRRHPAAAETKLASTQTRAANSQRNTEASRCTDPRKTLAMRTTPSASRRTTLGGALHSTSRSSGDAGSPMLDDRR